MSTHLLIGGDESTDPTGGSPAAGVGRPSSWRWPLWVGAAFTAAWVAGLSVFASSTQVRSSGPELVRSYAGHQSAGVLQFVLTEGVAGLALAGIVVAIARAASTGPAPLFAPRPRVGRLLLGTGCTAAAVSLVQCLLGIRLAAVLVPAGRAGQAHTVFEVVNRLDGVKMLLLAGFAVATWTGNRSGRLALPRWLSWVALALAVAISVSAVGYLFLLSGPAAAAWVSLPLLLVFITGSGVVIGRRGR